MFRTVCPSHGLWIALLPVSRWDTPQHVLVDDPEPGPEGPEYIWPGMLLPTSRESPSDHPTGKDYSNPRVLDFHTLHKPNEDMYDRTKVPRMPWWVSYGLSAYCYRNSVLLRHDVSMQVVGQPARDLARHFVQRWVYRPTHQRQAN